jgi:hydroxyacylglutathione hydrolase
MIQLIALRALESNYIWLLRSEKQAWVVDPGESEPVLNYLAKEGLDLVGVLVTHFHWDHTDGISALLKNHPALRILGPKDCPYPGIGEEVVEGDHIEVLGESFNILEIPGHTEDHIGFIHPRWAFIGDLLFGAGAGLFFMKSPKHARESFDKILALPQDTLICTGHEYTLANLKFALHALPNNPEIQARWQQSKADHKAGIALSPTRLSLEKTTNPFLLFRSEEMLSALAKEYRQTPQDANEAVGWIRAWKDRFDGFSHE